MVVKRYESMSVSTQWPNYGAKYSVEDGRAVGWLFAVYSDRWMKLSSFNVRVRDSSFRVSLGDADTVGFRVLPSDKVKVA